MRLIIKNKWISLKGSSFVKDEKGNDVLQVEGKFWTVTRKKYVKDLDGNIVYIVRNKYWKFIHYQAFIMDKNEKIISHVVRKAFSLHDH